MGFVQDITTSLRLSVASLRLLFQAPGVLALPLGTLLWTGLWAFGPASFFIWWAENHPEASARFWKGLFFISVQAWQDGEYGLAISSAIIEGYVLYAMWLTIVLTGVLYFLTVGMHVASQQIRKHGKTPSLQAGFQVANQNLGRLFLMALFNATVFAWVRYSVRFGLRAVMSPTYFIPVLGRMMRKVVLGTVGYVLTAVSYLMLPIIVYERKGAYEAMKSAWTNVKKTWSGILVGSGLLFGGIWALMNFFAWGLFQLTFKDPTFAIIFSIVTAAIAYAFASAASAAMRATLYWYATTGEVPEGFRVDDLPEIDHTNQRTITGNPYAV